MFQREVQPAQGGRRAAVLKLSSRRYVNESLELPPLVLDPVWQGGPPGGPGSHRPRVPFVLEAALPMLFQQGVSLRL